MWTNYPTHLYCTVCLVEDFHDVPNIMDINEHLHFMQNVLRMLPEKHFSLIISKKLTKFPLMDLIFSWLVMTATLHLVTFGITSINHFIKHLLPYWRHFCHYSIYDHGSTDTKAIIHKILNKVEQNPPLYHEVLCGIPKDLVLILERALLTAVEHKFLLHTIVIHSINDLLAMESTIKSHTNLVLIDFGLNRKDIITTAEL